jgi:hypothetical protein
MRNRLRGWAEFILWFSPAGHALCDMMGAGRTAAGKKDTTTGEGKGYRQKVFFSFSRSLSAIAGETQISMV